MPIITVTDRMLDLQESNGEVILEDRDPILVRKMLEFLYTGDYTFEAPNAKGSFKSENTSGEVSHTDLDQDLQVSQGETSSAHPRTDQAFFSCPNVCTRCLFSNRGIEDESEGVLPGVLYEIYGPRIIYFRCA